MHFFFQPDGDHDAIQVLIRLTDQRNRTDLKTLYSHRIGGLKTFHISENSIDLPVRLEYVSSFQKIKAKVQEGNGNSGQGANFGFIVDFHSGAV